MRHDRRWIARVFVLMLVAAAAALLASPDLAVMDPAQQSADDGPDAACRLMPECWTNADCDAGCGAGLGKCIHSKCPIRVCRCR